MRDITLVELDAVSGGAGPPAALLAGGIVGGVTYVGAQAGAGTQPTFVGAAGAVITGAVAGVFAPATVAQTAGAALAGFYGGLAGGYVSRGAGGGGGGGGA